MTGGVRVSDEAAAAGLMVDLGERRGPISPMTVNAAIPGPAPRLLSVHVPLLRRGW